MIQRIRENNINASVGELNLVKVAGQNAGILLSRVQIHSDGKASLFAKGAHLRS